MENNNINLLAENVSLREILNNINSGLYEINEYNNIRITSKNKPSFVILTVEANIIEPLTQFFEDVKFQKFSKEKIIFESTFNDFVVVALDENQQMLTSSVISLFELVLSSEILQLEESEKWNLDSTDFQCFEINYIEKQETEIPTDMKIIG